MFKNNSQKNVYKFWDSFKIKKMKMIKKIIHKLFQIRWILV